MPVELSPLPKVLIPKTVWFVVLSMRPLSRFQGEVFVL